MFNYSVLVLIALIAFSVQAAIIRLPTPSPTPHIEIDIDQPTNETVIDPSILNILSTGISELFALKEYAKNVTTELNTSVERFEVVDTTSVERSDGNLKLKLRPKAKSTLLIDNFQNAVVKTDYIGNFESF